MIRAIVNQFLRNPVLANILMVVFLVGGVFGMFSMVRESFPDFSLGMVQVTIPYPGATPDEVEEGICRPLEDALEGIADVKRVTTSAAEGVATAIIECENGADVMVVKDDVRTKVESVSTFPKDSESPVIREMKFDQPVVFVAIWGDLPERQLKDLAEEVKDEIVSIPGVSRATLSGTRDYQLSIEVSEPRLRQYGLTFDDVSRAVSQSSLNLPGGTIRGTAEDLKIRILGQKYYGTEYEQIVLLTTPDGAVVHLGDVAQVRDTFDDESESFALFMGHPAINLNVLKTRTEDSIVIAKAVYSYIDKKQQTLPEGVHLVPWLDQSRLIEDRIDLLLSNGLKGLILVFVVLWLFLDLRLSFWVSLGIFVSAAGGLAIMALTGQSLNMISLFGFIMVLGIVVDDSIVVSESIYMRRSNGEGAFESALNGTAEVYLPVIMAAMTTIAAFIPLYFVSGTMGKFIAVIPTPVIAALVVSLFESLYILPVHLRHLPDMAHKSGEPTAWQRYNPAAFVHRFVNWSLATVIRRIYVPILRFVVDWRYLTCAFAAALVMTVFGLMAAGFIKQEMFPSADSDYVQCAVEMPIGVPIEQTERVNRQILAGWEKTVAHFSPRLQQDHKLTNGLLSTVGGTLGMETGMPLTGNHLTEVFIELLPSEVRHIKDRELIDFWRDATGPIAGAVSVRFGGVEGGPPGGSIEIDLLGRDQEKLVAAQDELKAHLATYNGVFDINSDYKAGKTELRVNLKPSARPLGLTLQDLGQQLRQGFFGDEIARIQRGQQELKVMVRYTDAERHSIDQLNALRIRTPSGDEAPLSQVADIERAAGFATITRVEGQRKISITADALENVDQAQIMTSLFKDFLPALETKYDVTARLGVNSADQESSQSTMMAGAVMAILMIYLIMATMFSSYIQPAIIVLTMPIGVAGALFAHKLLGFTVSMMTFFGMIALAGVVVNDAIVFIDAVNERLAGGMPLMTALVDAGQRRFRAILLTSATTFFGLVPMILEQSFQAAFLIPMAITMAFGVATATVGTLIVIPCLLGILNDLRCLVYLMIHLRLPDNREVVEPNAHREGA